MQKTSLKQTLALNVQSLMERKPELSSQAKVGAKAKIDQKTVSRILNATHATTLDKLEALAAAMHVEPWQLIAPKLGADLYIMDAEKRLISVELKTWQEQQAPRHFQPPPLPSDAAELASRGTARKQTSARSVAKPKAPAKAGPR